MQNITSIGTKLILTDAVHPSGFTVTQAPQDGTFWEVPNVDIGNVQATLNGHGVFYGTPNVITINISVIPNGEDDQRFSESVAFARAQGITFNDNPFAISKLEPDGKLSVYGTFHLTSVPVDTTMNTDGSMATKTYTLMGVNKLS